MSNLERQFGARSQEVHATLRPELQQIVTFILFNIADISLLDGHREEERQNAAYRAGTSKVAWPDGKHNTLPSDAVDLQPYPLPNIDAEDPVIRDKARRKLWATLGYIAGAARVYAMANGWRLRWGGDWDMDGDLTDQNFDDLYHLEIIPWPGGKGHDA
jgi:hypothetical protein